MSYLGCLNFNTAPDNDDDDDDDGDTDISGYNNIWFGHHFDNKPEDDYN